MKKLNLMIALCLCAGAVFAQEETTTPEVWDIMDRTMGEDWKQEQEGVAGGSIKWMETVGKRLKPNTKEWSVTPQTDDDGMTFIKLKKTGTGATDYTAIVNSAGGGIVTEAGKEYTYEYKVRINAIDTTVYSLSSGYEMNVLSARLNKALTDVYLSRTKEGKEYVATKFNKLAWGKEDELGAMVGDTIYVDVDFSKWHRYRFILAADAKTFDFYIDGKLILDDVATGSDSKANLLKVGTASERSRIDMDIAYAKMATGALIPEEEEVPNPPTFNDELIISEISVYPTVLSRGAQLSVTAQSEDMYVEIFDLNGKKLSSANSSVVEAPAIPGMYIIKVIANGDIAKETKIVVLN